jgi:hypothetical protein
VFGEVRGEGFDMTSRARSTEPMTKGNPASAPHIDALSPTARRVLSALHKHVTLAWPILKAQCEIAGVDPRELSDGDVEPLVGRLVDAVSKFAGAAKADLLRDELLGLDAGPRSVGRSSATIAFRPDRPVSRVAEQAIEILMRYTPLAWPLFESQCKAARLDTSTLDVDGLKIVIGSLRGAVDRFGAGSRGNEAAEELLRFVDRA